MARFLVNRTLRLLATLLVVSMLTFGLTGLLPGDPALNVLPENNITPETIAEVRADMGLDKPLPQRYGHWLGNVVTGDLGQSYTTDQPVTKTIRERAPVTVQLGIVAIVLSLLVAVPLGVFSAYKQGRVLDKVISWIVQMMLSVPVFISGVFLIYVFAVRLGWLPATTWVRLTDDPLDNLRHVLLPAMSLATIEIAVYTRLVRADMISTLQNDYILAARAKGLTNRFILFRHALRPSSLSLITVVGLNIGAILGGAVIIESLFALPGLGGLLVESILRRDLIVVQGVVLFIAAGYVLVNTLVDVVYAAADPRIRIGGAGR